MFAIKKETQFRYFSAESIIENLRDPDTEPVTSLPFHPKGGELYKFKAEVAKAQDWRADSHRWINQGTVALLMRTLLNLQITKKQCQMLPN